MAILSTVPPPQRNKGCFMSHCTPGYSTTSTRHTPTRSATVQECCCVLYRDLRRGQNRSISRRNFRASITRPDPTYPGIQGPHSGPIPVAGFLLTVRHVQLEYHDFGAVFSSRPTTHTDVAVESFSCVFVWSEAEIVLNARARHGTKQVETGIRCEGQKDILLGSMRSANIQRHIQSTTTIPWVG